MQHRVSRWAAVVWAAGTLAAVSACSSSSTKPASSSSSAAPPAAKSAAPPPHVPAGYHYEPPAAKTNPDVVEETPTYYVQRFKKSDMIKVDGDRIRYPYMSVALPIYREDDQYYYVRTEKVSPEEQKAERDAKKRAAEEKAAADRAELEKEAKTNPLIVTPEQFDTLVPARSAKSVRFARAGEGLPARGQWRQNIAVADIDGDGHPDIVASPSRLSGKPLFHVWRGDGHGNFTEQKVVVVTGAGTKAEVKLDYGGVAVADFDGDGRPDVAVASHNGTVKVFLNRGDGKFQLDTDGLPPRISSQAIAAFDVNGDRRPDLVVSQDMVNVDLKRKTGKDYAQVRVLLNRGGGKWEADPKAIQGACFSFNVFPIDLAGGADARDLLTGCRFLGGWGLTWKNDGKGEFSNELFEIIEQAAYHFAVAPGTVGKSRQTAFADLYSKDVKGFQAGGLNVYFKEAGSWRKIPVWRQKNFRGRLTSVAMGDLDGDGLDDVVFPDRSAGRVRIFFQTPQGAFEESPEADEPALDSPVADTRLVDVDGDGRVDIIMAKTVYSELPKDPGGIEVLLNRGR